PDETLEHASALLGGDTGPVVIDLERHSPVTLAKGERHPGPRMPGSIVDQVPQHSAQRGDIALYAAGRHGRRVDPERPRVTQPPGFVEDQVVEVDRAGAQLQLVL